MAKGKGAHVLQLFALWQDPHPALGHPVEVGPVGNHLQHTQVIQLYGGQREQLTNQRPVKWGWCPAARKKAHLVARRGWACCKGVRKYKSGFTESSTMPVRNDNPPLPPQDTVRALPAHRGRSLVQSPPKLKLWQGWRVGFGAWVLVEVLCMWKGLDSETSDKPLVSEHLMCSSCVLQRAEADAALDH